MTRARRHINISFLLAVIALLSPSFLLSSCSSGDDGMNEPTPQDKQQEILFNPSVWQVMGNTRATVMDNSNLRSYELACYAYDAGTATVNTDAGINGTTHATWNGSSSRWVFNDGPHYWPASGDLDFFVYPYNVGPVSSVTYSSGHIVSFDCDNLPVSLSGQSVVHDFVYALALEKNKSNSSSGVVLNFVHPFTLINIQLAAGHPSILINNIKFTSIYNYGHYSNSWAPSGSTVDFVWDLNNTYDNSESNSVLVLGNPCLVIPQSWEGVIEVNATWNVWGESQTKTISTDLPGTITWLPGRSYTYTFTITETDLIVDSTKYTEQW